MSLQEAYALDKETLKIIGFTDLGVHISEEEKKKLGNHALVMFQPFSGSWIQPIGCFLSRGAATSDELYPIILESIVLLENSGLKVNAVVSDAAQWNRGMWALFGITEEKVHCEHLFDVNRKLWFISDFPHLIKNLRNWMTKGRVFKVCIPNIFNLPNYSIPIHLDVHFFLCTYTVSISTMYFLISS